MREGLGGPLPTTTLMSQNTNGGFTASESQDTTQIQTRTAARLGASVHGIWGGICYRTPYLVSIDLAGTNISLSWSKIYSSMTNETIEQTFNYSNLLQLSLFDSPNIYTL